MAEREVTLPSGLSGTVRGWRAKEANLLANRKEARTGKSFDKMLANCWLGTTETGPYGFSNGSVPWHEVLTCDRFSALLAVRMATYGTNYAFVVPCEDRQLCRKRIDWEFELDELPFKKLPEDSRAKVAAGDNDFTYELKFGEEAGTLVHFHLQTGEGEARAAKLIDGEGARVVVASLASRITSIDGIEKGGLVRFLDELEMQDLSDMLEAFDDVDGGYDTDIEIECPHCGLVQDVTLPLEGGFWLPRRKRKRLTKRGLDAL